MNPPHFAGKTVLVTGAADGIGRATALASARDGADLILCDIDGDALERTADEIRERVYEMYRACRWGPDNVARAIVRGVRRRRAVVKVALEGWAFAVARRLCPGVAPRLFKGVFDRMLGLRRAIARRARQNIVGNGGPHV